MLDARVNKSGLELVQLDSFAEVTTILTTVLILRMANVFYLEENQYLIKQSDNSKNYIENLFRHYLYSYCMANRNISLLFETCYNYSTILNCITSSHLCNFLYQIHKNECFQLIDTSKYSNALLAKITRIL